MLLRGDILGVAGLEEGGAIPGVPTDELRNSSKVFEGEVPSVSVILVEEEPLLGEDKASLLLLLLSSE